MRKWTKTAGLLFLAAASVYTSRAIVAAPEGEAILPATDTANVAFASAAAPARNSERLVAAPADATEVKLLDEATDPFAAGTGATTQPAGGATTQPADGAIALGEEPTSQPSEGRSVSSSEVSVNDAGTVEIHVNDANLVEVLRMLSLQSQKNIVASKDVHGTVTANLYDVTVREALDAILHANGYAYREKGNFIYVYTAKEIAEIEKNERQMSTHVFRVFYTPAANAANMIKPVLSKAGGEVAVTTPSKSGISSQPGGGGGNDHASDEILVVTDYPENIEAARRILDEVDRRPQQILLEATILRATLNEDNALGVDFNVMGGVDMAGVVSGGPQITGSGVTDGAGGVLGDGGVLPGGRNHSVGTGNAFSGAVPGGLKVGVVSDTVSIFLAALEQVTDTTIMANPKILALNRQQGEVFVGNEDGYLTTVTTETTTSQSVESLKTGTRLIFRPYVASDGFIRMEVHPEDSDGSVKANGLPSKSTTEVTSNIMVKDGHTIVIGGLFRESTVSSKSQVPFVGNLPLVGLLFKNQRDRTVREEVIILLTPHIVKDDVAYSRMSEQELRMAEQLRVGVRKGLMPWGRERMAEGWYESAKKEMAKPKPNRGAAKWHLDAAINLNPHFAEAMKLREELSGYELTAADGSTIRGFVRRAILNDVVPSTQPTTAPVIQAEAPATQPFTFGDATAEAPATQPSEEMTAENPTTQPTEEVSVEAPMDEVISVPTEETFTVPTEETEPMSDEFEVPAPVTEELPAPVTDESSSTGAAPAEEGTAEVLTEEGTAEVMTESDNEGSVETESSESTESAEATEEEMTESVDGEYSPESDEVTATPVEE